MSAAAAAASKCATLRQGGRYGGSLGAVKAAASPSPNLKVPTQPPTVATVSKDYTSSYSTTLPYNAQKKSNVASAAERKEEKLSVYSIDASYHRQASGKSQESSATKGISILNQPLPEIPQSAIKMTEQVPKNMQQPLCAANLNQYRSLQRPGMQKSSFAQPPQTVPLKSSMKQPQAPPPKVVPPQLPPKNRHKELDGQGRSQQRQVMQKGQNFSTLQYPSKHHQGSTHTTFGYDNKSREGHGYLQSGMLPPHEKKYESSRMTSFHGDVAPGYPMKVSKQSYQTMPHQPKYQSGSSKSHGHHQPSHQQPQRSSKREEPPVYYRSLQRGSANTSSGAHNDLYSVTEL